MKKLLLITGIMLAGAAVMAKVTIVSGHVIYPEKVAAYRLAFYLEKMLGEKVEVVKEAKGPAIYVGKTVDTAKMLGLPNFVNLKYEEIFIKSTKDGNLVIAGAGSRGTLYAMYTYLEDFLGFRFWSMNEFDVPPKENFTMANINHRYNPVFLRRCIYQFPLPHLPGQWKSGNPEFAAICRMNSGLTQTHTKFGGGDYKAGFVHTLRRIMPPGKYFKTNPEYFSLINGRREHNNAQLCFSNKEMRKAFAAAAKEYYKREKGNYAISISHNDNGGWCECAPCKELLKREKGRMSGVMLDFVNEVAAELQKTHPRINVETLAYGATLEPPLVTKPAKNVFVRFCDMSGNPGYPITHEVNRASYERFMKWSEMSNVMGVWCYFTNAQNQLIPQPTMDTYEANLKFYRDHKVNDVFVEGNPTAMGLGHLNNLQVYVLRKMMWDPNLKYDDLIKDFTDGYYGKKAAPFVRQYIKQLHAPLYKKIKGHQLIERLAKGYHIKRQLLNTESYKKAVADPNADIYNPIEIYMNHALAFMSRQNMIECVKLLDKAIAVAENQKFKDRLFDAAFNIRVALLTDNEIADNPAKYGFTAEQLKKMAQETLSAAIKSGEKRYGLKNSGFSVVENQISRNHNLVNKKIPDFLKNIPPRDINFFNYKDWSVMIPKMITVIDDKEAISGKALRYKNVGPTWALQCRNVAAELPPGKYNFYLRIRLIPKKGVKNIRKGIFFNAAFYLRLKTHNYSNSMLRAQAEKFADGKYHWVPAGTSIVNTDSVSYFFCDPTNHPDVEAIVVDQLIAQKIKD